MLPGARTTRLNQAAPEAGELALADDLSAGSGDRRADALTTLGAVASRLVKLRGEFYGLNAAQQLRKPGGNFEALLGMVHQAADGVYTQPVAVHGTLRQTAYPYNHARRDATVSRFAAPGLPGSRGVLGIHRVAESTLEACYGPYARLLGDLAQQGGSVRGRARPGAAAGATGGVASCTPLASRLAARALPASGLAALMHAEPA